MVQVFHARQEVVAQHRRHRYRHQQRGQCRDDEGNAQRHKQLAFQARQSKKRKEDQHDDHRRIEDRRADFHGRLGHEREQRQALAWVLGTVFFHAPQDVFHIHHGIVHQSANGNRQPPQRHGVDRQAKILEHQCRDEDGHWDGGERNDGGANRAQEEEQDRGHKQRGADEFALQRRDRGLDEAGLPEGHTGCLHPRRKGCLEIPNRFFNRLCQTGRVSGWLLLNAQNHGWLAFKACIPTFDGCGKSDLSDLAQQDGLTVLGGDGQIAQVLQAGSATKISNQVLAPVELQKSP